MVCLPPLALKCHLLTQVVFSATLVVPSLNKSKQMLYVRFHLHYMYKHVQLLGGALNRICLHMFGCALISIFHTPGLDTQLQQDMPTITEIKQPTGWVVTDVPRDSNSMHV